MQFQFLRLKIISITGFPIYFWLQQFASRKTTPVSYPEYPKARLAAKPGSDAALPALLAKGEEAMAATWRQGERIKSFLRKDWTTEISKAFWKTNSGMTVGKAVIFKVTGICLVSWRQIFFGTVNHLHIHVTWTRTPGHARRVSRRNDPACW